MSEAVELEKIRQVLKQAQQQINQQQPDLAIESLRRIKDQVEACSDSPEWAEWSLQLGEAYTAKHSEAAKSFLLDAKERIATLARPVLDLEFRLHDHLGYFSQEVEKKLSTARTHYEHAKDAAIKLGSGELTARTQLRIIRIELQVDTDPELENFKTLRRVAHEHNLLCEDQLAAWYQHYGDRSFDQASPLYARGMQRRTDEYFLDLLRSVGVHK